MTALATPRVTTIIPAYNAAATLARALASAAAQAGVEQEILVVDDGSEDATRALATAAAAADPRIRLIALDCNGGVSAASNAGIRAARGEYVAFLDADDEWRPGKLAAQVARLDADPELLLCATAAEWRRADGALLMTVGPPPGVTPATHFAEQYACAHIALPSVMVRASAFARHGGFDAALATGQDQDLWLRLALAGPIAMLAEPLTVIHVAPQSLTGRQGLANFDAERQLVDRYFPAVAERLGTRRARRLRARRHAIIGRDLIAAGAWAPGARLLLPSMLRGVEPVRGLRALIAGALRRA